MKSNKEVNEQVNEENQTQKGRAKKGTSNAKIMPLGVQRFSRKKNTYGLKEIDGALNEAKLERHHDDVLRLNLLKIILSFLLPNKGRNVEVRYVDLVDNLDHLNRFSWGKQVYNILRRNHIEAPAIGVAPAIEPPAVSAPVIGSSSFATEIRVALVKLCSQLEEHCKILQKLEVHCKMLQNHGKILEQILMYTVRDSTLPLGDTSLLGQYQFSTFEKSTKRKQEEEGNEKEDGIRKKAELRT
ncbi:hypothetical protein GIB67_008459 [Kingdonia uniflora]|uniref:Uncharacterized protein n=1 Tax=Kingdonia uniflora TaxID=39325 RepID=A0A7J7N5P5_9MAGN|nr:hypothetical protein GIB67_008459 [Kingdonia uniflora]